jgi:hypothetical protein
MLLILVKLIGAYIFVIGVILLFSPQKIKGLIAVFAPGKRLYLVGVLRILIGAILLWAASQCKLTWLVAGVGILAMVMGLLYFVLGLERLKAMLSRWDKRPVLLIRFIGLVIMIIGALLIYST